MDGHRVVLLAGDLGNPDRNHTMATDLRMALEDLLRKAQMDRDADFLREGVWVLAQALMELEVTQHLSRSPKQV